MTETDICNLALARIGAARIAGEYTVSPGDQTYASARACQDCYAVTRDRLLRSHPWNFAITRVVLATPDTTPPAFGWTNRFPLPSGCLRALKVNDSGEDAARKDWTVEGGFVLTDDDSVDLEYVARVTSVSLFDPLFIQALVVLLAVELATVLTRGDSFREGLLKEYEAITAPLARRVDANEQRLTLRLPYMDSDLVLARYGGVAG